MFSLNMLDYPHPMFALSCPVHPDPLKVVGWVGWVAYKISETNPKYRTLGLDFFVFGLGLEEGLKLGLVNLAKQDFERPLKHNLVKC